MVATAVHLISIPNMIPGDVIQQVSDSNINVQMFLISGLLFSSVGGLVVAAILKKLDNVVKVNIIILHDGHYTVTYSIDMCTL